MNLVSALVQILLEAPGTWLGPGGIFRIGPFGLGFGLGLLGHRGLCKKVISISDLVKILKN